MRIGGLAVTTAPATCLALALAVPPLAHAVTASAEASLAVPEAIDEQQSSGLGFDEHAFALAQAGYGFGKVVARALTTWDIQPGDFAGTRSSTATATSGFVDTLTIRGGPGQEGTVGVLWFDTLLTFNAQTEQSVRGSAVGNTMTGRVVVNWDVRSPNAAFIGGSCSYAEGAVTPSDVSCDGFALDGGTGSDYTARLRGGTTFFFGQPFTLGLRVIGEANAAVRLQNTDTGGTARSWLDAGQSVYWDGIAAVTTLDGTTVDYTVSALSGTDYRMSLAPIPEPASYALMTLGLAAVGWRARRRTG